MLSQLVEGGKEPTSTLPYDDKLQQSRQSPRKKVMMVWPRRMIQTGERDLDSEVKLESCAATSRSERTPALLKG
jgi:hypothetical protein